MQSRIERRAELLSKGKLLPLQHPVPGKPGTPRIIANGLGRYYVGRPVMNGDERIVVEYAPDPERVLELAATRIQRERFSEPTFDYTRTFPVTRQLAYAAFEDTRPKNQPPKETPDERMERTMYDHLDGTSQAWNV